ncbi:MAG TPA: EthD family reductase [Gaiellaceae bacterium]|nr:EthD family reductase [Gaiellaceae bacterium]
MLKLISLMRRAEGMTKEDFSAWVLDEHTAIARDLPGLRAYSVSITGSGDSPYDCVNEMYFDDEEARAAAFASEVGQKAAADAAAHASERVHLVTTEYKQL